jgi:predicted amidohydrolase YtcJ
VLEEPAAVQHNIGRADRRITVLLTNGRIYTMDGSGSVVDSLIVRDGRIVFAGGRGEINAGVGEETIDLGGRAVLPGLVDAHAHLMHLARARLSLRVGHLASEDAAARVVAEAARAAAPGEWLTGRGWDQTLWPGQRFPSKSSLDAAAPGNPVALVRVDGHATWANSTALAAAGITADTPDPQGGRVERDERGEPTGLLVDRAQDLLRSVVPAPSEERLDAAARDAIAECVAKGLTGLHEMSADLPALGGYRRLVDRGHLQLRCYVAVSGAKAWTASSERGPDVVGDGRLVIGALKLWLDGALGSRGAALHAPYCDDPQNVGLLLIPPDELERLVGEAAGHGFQVCVHAIGDRANTLALDVFERVMARGLGHDARPRPGSARSASPMHAGSRYRFRIEHAQILTESDIPRFRRLGVLPSMQPTHCTSDMLWAAERLGPDRLRGAYAWRSLLETGTIIAGGSDFPVEDVNPFHGIHAAVTRQPLSGEAAPWRTEERMTRQEAVRAFTVWNAIASGQERDTGSLEPGKRADLVVLSDDVFACAESRIAAITPVMTMVDGEVVYRSET